MAGNRPTQAVDRMDAEDSGTDGGGADGAGKPAPGDEPGTDPAAAPGPDERGNPDAKIVSNEPNPTGSSNEPNPPGDVTPTEASPGRLVLIGTGHVFQIQDAIRDAVLALRPQAVFVELDHGRLRALQDRRAGREPPTRGNWIQRRLQRFQENLAQSYGAEAGGEMLAALEGASQVGARAYLVDRRVDITLQRALKQLTWRERLRAVGMVVGGSLKALVPGRRDAKAQVEKELARYNQDPEAALEELATKFPTVRRVLIDERDTIMADRIRAVLATTPLGIAVVGDGHVPGMLRHLAELDITVYRLEDARQGRLPRPTGWSQGADAGGMGAEGATSRFSFGFDV